MSTPETTEALRRLGEAARDRASSLDLSRLDLSELPDSLGNLTNLTGLDLGGNQLTELPDFLGNLTNLTVLDLDGNQLTELPDSLGNLTNLTELYLADNPLVCPPPEICELGTAAVLGFLRCLRAGDERQWMSKMLVVGEAAVGKTSVTKALCGMPYDRDEPQTHGVHVDPLLLDHPSAAENPVLNTVKMQLSVWDFGGQLEYRATQRFYLSDRSLFLLVWNSRRGWRAGGQVVEWLEAITTIAPHSPILVVATHTVDSVVDLPETELRQRFPSIAGFARVDCADGTGIDQLTEQIRTLAAALPLMGQRWPSIWTAAATRLANEPDRYIGLNRCEAVMADAGIPDAPGRAIVRAALHDRGEILHYPHDPELAETVVLQPAWVDAMITRVLDSQQVTDRGGLLSREHRAHLWKDLDDPGLREMLTVLMERFDLAYRTDTPGSPDVALVVERLPAGQPEQLPDAWHNALQTPGANELRLRYKLSSRQAGIPSWFIAREHRFTTGTAWSHGVLLQYRGQPEPALALLVDDGAAQPTLDLTVRGTGPSAFAFYSILDEGFTGILHDRYPGLNLRRMIPCPCTPSPEAPCNHEFDFTAVQRAVERDIPQLQCQQTFEPVDPRTLLLGLKPVPLDVIYSRLEGLTDSVNDTRTTADRIERAQLQVLDTVRDLLGYRSLQGAHCPSIFTLTKTGATGYQLQLYCEQPDSPHPLPDGDGTYQLTRLPHSLLKYAPYLRMILTGLRYALPVVGPALIGLAGATLTEVDKNRLEASCKLLEGITAIPPGTDLGTNPALTRQQAPHEPADIRPQRTTADFAELRAALLEIAPDFGGLSPRQLPENRGIAYLCTHHRQALRYPQQTPEPTA